MADGRITEAVQTGQHIRVTVSVDEGAAGIVPYTALVAIADLKALSTAIERRAAIISAVKAVREKQLEQGLIEKQLANLIGTTVTL